MSPIAGARLSRHYELFLYHNVHSYLSQRIYFALLHYKIKFTSQEINYLANENLKPWFIRINLDASLPVLRHGNLILINTLLIIEYLENYFSNHELELFPSNHFHKIKRFMEMIDNFNIRILRYYVFCDPELKKNLLVPDEIADKEISNLLNLKNLSEEYIQTQPDLYIYYSELLDKANSILTCLKEKSYIDEIYLSMEKILDEIEIELCEVARKEAQRMESKRFAQNWKNQMSTLYNVSSSVERILTNNKSSLKKKSNFSKNLKTSTNLDYKPLISNENAETHNNDSPSSKPQNSMVLLENKNLNQPHVTISIPHELKGSIFVSDYVAPMSKNSDGKTPLWLCNTRELSGADIWLIVFLNEIYVLGLSPNYWNDKGLRPHLNNYFKLVRSYLKPPLNFVFDLYSERSKEKSSNSVLIEHKHTQACFRWLNQHFAGPVLNCLGFASPSTRHYKVFYWTFGISIAAISATSIGLFLYYSLYNNSLKG